MKSYNHPDLHLHSVFSDGSDPPLALLEKLRNSDIDLFSLTDHDSYLGCIEICKNLRDGDPDFLTGIEFSCRDTLGKYHILGYRFSLEHPAIQKAVEITHRSRRERAQNRLRFLEDTCQISFTEEESGNLLRHENPGKPHFAELLLKKGAVSSKEEGFAMIDRYHGQERKLTPEEAIHAIREAGGIPVLAHGILADGSGLLSEEEISSRVERLTHFGLTGLECYYSAFTQEQTETMLSLAERFHLLITAGSDYHGKNKPVSLGESGNPLPSALSALCLALQK